MDFIVYIEKELTNFEKSIQNQKSLQCKTREILNSIRNLKQKNKEIFKNNNTKNTVDIIIRDLYHIFVIAFESKNTNIVLLGLSLIQKLLFSNCLDTLHHLHLISQIMLLQDISDQSIQLKMMQTILTFVTPEIMTMSNFDMIKKLFTIAFKLSKSHNLMIQTLAFNALMQSTQYIFSDKSFQRYTNVETDQAFSLVQDLMNRLTENKTVSWICKDVQQILWEIIMQIIKLQGARLQKIKILMNKFEAWFMLVKKKCFLQTIQDIKKIVRYYRYFCYCIMYLNIGSENIKQLSFVTQLERNIRFMIYIEGIMMILAQRNTFERYEKNKSYLILLQIILKICERLHPKNNLKILLTKKNKDYLKNSDIFQTIDQKSKYIFQDGCIISILVNGLKELRINYEKYINQSQNRQKQDIYLSNIIPLLMNIYKVLCLIDYEEQQIRKIIQELQFWFVICGKCNFEFGKNMILLDISYFSNKFEKKLSAITSSQSIQILFNILVAYQIYLNPKNLGIIHKTLQIVQEIFYKFKNNKQWLAEVGFTLEDQIIVIDKLYDKNTIVLTNQQLKLTLESLNQLTLHTLQEISQHPNTYSMRLKMFGARKLKVLLENNYERLNQNWDLVMAHFKYLCQFKQKQLRSKSIQMLSGIILNLLIANIIEQEHLLSSYCEIIKSKYIDVKILIIQNITKFLTDHGFKITEKSLLLIIDILKQVQDYIASEKNKDETKQLSKISNQLHEIIIKQSLVFINHFSILYKLIENYRIQSNNKNIEYTAVNNLWLISDQLKRVQQDQINNGQLNQIEFYDVTFLLFKKLYQISLNNDQPQVRQSGIHTLTQVFAEYFKLFSHKHFLQLYHDTYFHLFVSLIKKYEKMIKCQKDLSMQEPEDKFEKDWEQTTKCMIVNFVKLVKKLHDVEKLQRIDMEQIIEIFYKCIQLKVHYQGFYIQLLGNFLQLKRQIIKQDEHGMCTKIMEYLKQKVQNINTKQRLNRSKIIPLINQIVT